MSSEAPWRVLLLSSGLFCFLLSGSVASGAQETQKSEAGAEEVLSEIVPEVTPTLAPPIRPSFDGAWEKDFRRSDKWEDELTRQLDQMRRNAQRARSGGDLNSGPVVTVRNSRSRGRGASIIDLAQLAGFISRQTTMRIEQSAVQVRVKREGDADLVCSTLTSVTESFASEFGDEICGWEAHQLVFRITLPDGVMIEHRFIISEDREQLNMATTLSSGGSVPFTLRQFFQRYDAPEENYNCTQTISRGNSCRLGGLPND